MRVTFAATHRDAYEGIQTTADRMLMYQRQVSTGVRVHAPSDDPSAAAGAVVEKGAIAAFEQYKQAGDSAEARLTVADTVLGDVVDKLASARTVILSMQGSAVTASQRAAGAQELASLRDAVLEDFNTSFHGTYIFGGATGDVRPYSKLPAGTVGAYAGSTREVSIEIDRGQSVATVLDGSAIAQGSDAADIFAAFEDAIAAVTAGDSNAMGVASQALARGFDRASHAQSGIGTSERAVADNRAQLDQATRASETRVAALEDANLAKAISGMQQAETAYQAALAAASRSVRLSLFDYIG